jgi:hypothetical protein
MQRAVLALFLAGLLGVAVQAQNGPLDLRWDFARSQGAAPIDTLRGVKAALQGEYAYVPGVAGDGLRFDGYTTSMTVPWRDADNQLPNGFSLGAWVALNTYPWNRVPIVDQEQDDQQGFLFGIDAFGHLVFDLSVDGQWQTLTSAATLPLKRWAQVAASYRTEGDQGELAIYVDGKPAGQLAVRGHMLPAQTDLLIGRVRQPMLPFPDAAAKPQYPIWYSLDGILDEIALYGAPRTAAEIAGSYAAAHVPAEDVLPWPKLPSGPPGPGRFGAYYATLHYQDTWDRLRRLGPDSDVVVRFDLSPIRLVFWQGTNYIPAWVTENNKWYTDEFVETWDKGCPAGGDCEPMSDKQSRYSRVNIVESNPARAVVHWRYADAEVEQLLGAWPDPRTGWFQWIDEYWTVYPDGVAIRKQVLHDSDTSRPHEWQETIVLHQPGSRPEDDINWDAITLENMQGQTKTYTWRAKPAGLLHTPYGPPGGITGPPDPNIQLVNIKSQWKPFQIHSPQGASADIYNNELTYFSFLCWNHWPVAQIASSDRPCVAADRASHSSLSHLYWQPYFQDQHTEIKLLMDGLTTKTPAELLPLAKSWLSPAAIRVESPEYSSGGYDPTQRDYVVTRTGPAARLRITLDGSAASPIVNPALLIKNWGEGSAALKVSGQPVAWGANYRVGHIEHLDRTDLILWLKAQSTEPFHIELIPVRK